MTRGRSAGVEDSWRKRDGTPTKRDGRGLRWRARWSHDGQQFSRAFRTKAEAQRYVEQVTADLVSGSYVPERAGLATVEQIHSVWARSQGHLAETTRATRETTWRAHVEPRWASVPVGEVLTSQVRSWVAQMVDQGAGAATIENALGLLRMVLDTAVEDRRISSNPCQGVKAPRREHRDRGYLTHEQVALLADTVSSGGVEVRLLALTGLRWGEMAALRVQDFDMLRRRINVSRSVTEVKGRLEWGTPKGHERRSVPFPSVLSEDLAKIMEGKAREDLVLSSPKGEVLRISTYRRRVFKPAVEVCQEVDSDFPSVTPHDLRHTAASLAISAGANVKAVQRMLGHKSAALTLDTYADLFPDDLDQVADALDQAARAAVYRPCTGER